MCFFVNSAFSPWFVCYPWWLPWGLICTHRLLLPPKVITLLTLPLSWIRPSKEKAICAKSCKDQGTVTKQTSIISPSYNLRSSSVLWKVLCSHSNGCSSKKLLYFKGSLWLFPFFPLTEATHPMNSTSIHWSSRKCLSIPAPAVLHEVIYYFSIPFHPYLVVLYCNTIKLHNIHYYMLQPPILLSVGDFSWSKSLLMNLRPSLIF